MQALLHASIACSRKLCIEWIAATDLEDGTMDEVMPLVGVLCFKGFQIPIPWLMFYSLV